MKRTFACNAPAPFTRLTFAMWLASILAFVGLHSTSAAPPITAAAFTPEGTQVVIGSQAGIEVLNWPDLSADRRLAVDLANVHHLAFSPNGKTLAAAGGAPREAGRVVFLNWPSGEVAQDHKLNDDVVYSFAWSSGSKGVAWAAVGGESLVEFHEGEMKTLALRGHSQDVLAVAVLDFNRVLLSAGRDRTIRVWDLTNGERLQTLNNHTDEVLDLAVRPDVIGLPFVASAGADRTVRFWQPTVGRLVRFARLQSTPLSICWTSDGTLLLASCADGRLRAVDPESAAIVIDQPAIDGWAYVVAAPPNGPSAFVAGENGQQARVSVRLHE